ncbi:hypothetical protein X777_12459 [Ooceraea biroi]|uniref:Uncharacterized protein n=1 Tax=Ooceraea biroi TaxID=2015173 RepID=A0A026VZN3_OOCBI|nr:hypothetical protein X777_12459 [Ooceraea biroi]
MECVRANSRTSTRQVASEVGCSNRSVWNIFHEHNLHPFKLTKVQDLAPGDPPQRLHYCQWLNALERTLISCRSFAPRMKKASPGKTRSTPTTSTTERRKTRTSCMCGATNKNFL